jgi:hypothetical protein
MTTAVHNVGFNLLAQAMLTRVEMPGRGLIPGELGQSVFTRAVDYPGSPLLRPDSRGYDGVGVVLGLLNYPDQIIGHIFPPLLHYSASEDDPASAMIFGASRLAGDNFTPDESLELVRAMYDASVHITFIEDNPSALKVPKQSTVVSREGLEDHAGDYQLIFVFSSDFLSEQSREAYYGEFDLLRDKRTAWLAAGGFYRALGINHILVDRLVSLDIANSFHEIDIVIEEDDLLDSDQAMWSGYLAAGYKPKFD